jgi:hypothetical protein
MFTRANTNLGALGVFSGVHAIDAGRALAVVKAFDTSQGGFFFIPFEPLNPNGAAGLAVWRR